MVVVTHYSGLTVAEMGELVGGSREGRTGDEEITLFKSVGLAVEDALAADTIQGESDTL